MRGIKHLLVKRMYNYSLLQLIIAYIRKMNGIKSLNHHPFSNPYLKRFKFPYNKFAINLSS